jgi:hypothetical protein
MNNIFLFVLLVLVVAVFVLSFFNTPYSQRAVNILFAIVLFLLILKVFGVVKI